MSPKKYTDPSLATWQDQVQVAETINAVTGAVQTPDEAGRLYHVPLAPEGQSSTAPISQEGRPA